MTAPRLDLVVAAVANLCDQDPRLLMAQAYVDVDVEFTFFRTYAIVIAEGPPMRGVASEVYA